MDDTTGRCSAALRRDGRACWAELGRLVGLSGPSVTDRVSRLEAAGVITGYHAAVDPARSAGRSPRWSGCTCRTPPTRTRSRSRCSGWTRSRTAGSSPATSVPAQGPGAGRGRAGADTVPPAPDPRASRGPAPRWCCRRSGRAGSPRPSALASRGATLPPSVDCQSAWTAASAAAGCQRRQAARSSARSSWRSASARRRRDTSRCPVSGQRAGMTVSGMGQLNITVSDLEASVRWYRDVLGLPHLFTVEGSRWRSSRPATCGCTSASPRTSGSAPGRSCTTRSRTSSRRTPR